MKNTETPFGFSKAILQQLVNVIHQYPEVKRALIYGSRARGDYKTGSDIDIAVDAPAMSDKRFAALWNDIQSLPVVYVFFLFCLLAKAGYYPPRTPS